MYYCLNCVKNVYHCVHCSLFAISFRRWVGMSFLFVSIISSIVFGSKLRSNSTSIGCLILSPKYLQSNTNCCIRVWTLLWANNKQPHLYSTLFTTSSNHSGLLWHTFFRHTPVISCTFACPCSFLLCFYIPCPYLES